MDKKRNWVMGRFRRVHGNQAVIYGFDSEGSSITSPKEHLITLDEVSEQQYHGVVMLVLLRKDVIVAIVVKSDQAIARLQEVANANKKIE